MARQDQKYFFKKIVGFKLFLISMKNLSFFDKMRKKHAEINMPEKIVSF